MLALKFIMLRCGIEHVPWLFTTSTCIPHSIRDKFFIVWFKKLMMNWIGKGECACEIFVSNALGWKFIEILKIYEFFEIFVPFQKCYFIV